MEAFVDYPTGETKRVLVRVACGAMIRGILVVTGRTDS